MLDAERLGDFLELTDGSMGVRELKANLSAVLERLKDGPVMVNVRNKPAAMIIDIHEYQTVLERAEAYEHIQLADEAEAGERFTLAEGREYIRRRRAERRAAREARTV